MADLITPDELIPNPSELVLRNGAPDTITGWKALADGLLTNQSCAFHRNCHGVVTAGKLPWLMR